LAAVAPVGGGKKAEVHGELDWKKEEKPRITAWFGMERHACSGMEARTESAKGAKKGEPPTRKIRQTALLAGSQKDDN